MSEGTARILERAFELARSGQCHSVDDIRRDLQRERHGNIEAHLAGPSIRAQLVKLMADAPRAEPFGED
jgi:hypothetical protein